MFEKSSDTQSYSIQLRAFPSRMHDILFYFTDMTNQEDLDCMTDNSSCKFRSYEEMKLAWLEKQIILAENQFREEHAPNTSTHESNAVEKLFKDISTTKSKIADALKCFKGKEKREHLIRTYNVITASCKFLLTSIDQIDLTPVFPIIFKETDAGPGVGVSNIEVRYRDVKLARMQNSCLVSRAHHAPHDSGMNGAERSNAAIGDAIVDGGVVDWQHFMPFDGLTEDETASLTTEDAEILKQNANKKISSHVAHELRNRIDDELGPAGDYMKAYVTLPENDQFFFNGSYLKEYVSATSISKKHSIPGHNYFSKMDSFIQSHVILGEMHLEFRKGRCLDKGRSCELILFN